MANVPKYSKAQRLKMERQSGRIMSAGSKSKNATVRKAAKSTATRLVGESMKTVKAKPKPKANTSKKLKSRAKTTAALLK